MCAWGVQSHSRGAWHAEAEASIGVLWPLDVHDGWAFVLVVIVVLSVVAKDNPGGLEVAIRCGLTDWELLDTQVMRLGFRGDESVYSTRVSEAVRSVLEAPQWLIWTILTYMLHVECV